MMEKAIASGMRARATTSPASRSPRTFRQVLGCDAIVVSNHGGRLLDGVPATAEVLPSVVDAVAGRCEVLVDGGIRRGTDIAKMIALGARACLVGRPYLHGLALAGEAGVRQVITILMAELDRTMGFLGVSEVAEIDASCLWRDGRSGDLAAPASSTVPPEVPAWM